MKTRFPFLFWALFAFVFALPALPALAQDSADADAEEAFEPSGNIWGYIFSDYIYKASGDDVGWGRTQYAGTETGFHGGELRRLYLGYNYRLRPNITTRVLLEANSGTDFANGSYGMLVKLGYLSWENPLPDVPLTVNVGLIPTPVFSFPEKSWGYRSVEKEALDARGIGRSADQGLSIEGALGEDGGFRLMAGNGSGTKPATDPHKSVYGSLYNRFMDGRLSIEVMGSYLPARGEYNRTIGRVFAEYTPGPFRMGMEAAYVYVETPPELGRVLGTNMSRLLISGFVAVPVEVGTRSVSLFGRYDFFDRDLDFDAAKGYVEPDPFYTQHLVIVGVDFEPVPDVHFMPNLWVNAYSQRGGAVSRGADVVPRVTVYFRYGK